ncbi:MAG TPA: hypothetical protein VMR02_03405 [Terracidiphilus sp.]|nr:hypothetical protein [Terracidiphilus sp.]
MMSEFEAQVLSDLSVLKTQMNGLMGDGNGGRIAELERRMERHEQNWQRAKGFLVAASVVFAVLEGGGCVVQKVVRSRGGRVAFSPQSFQAKSGRERSCTQHALV